MVCVIISRDVGVSLDLVDLGCYAVGEEIPRSSVDPPRRLLPWPRLLVCRSSNCSLLVAEDCHLLHSMYLQCFSLVDCHVKCESNRQQFGVEDLHTSSAQKPAARGPLISVVEHCCGSHSAIV